MEIEVSSYGIARDIMGDSALKLELEEHSTVKDLLNVLKEKFPEFGKLSSLLVAVNAAYAPGEYTIQKNDEVVLIPPVSGG